MKMTDHLILILFSAVNLSRLAIFKFNQKWPTVWSETNKKWSKKFALYLLLKIVEKYSFIIYSLSVKWDENMLGSVLAQRDRSETSLKWPRALLQISLSALGIQFGSRARRYNISRARRSVKVDYSQVNQFKEVYKWRKTTKKSTWREPRFWSIQMWG